VCCALTTQGIALAGLTPEALLFYANECRRLNLVVGARADSNRFAGLMAWDILHGMGHFPPGTPPTLRTYIYKGRCSPEQMVDFHGVHDPDVRQLIIDYIVRRQGDTDYVTREGLARAIAGSFWSEIEKIAPGQRDFNIALEVYDQWRETVRVRKDGSPRIDGGTGLLLPVRAFYMDLQSWALEEPERWARWAAPCPIPPSGLRASAGGDAGSRSGWPTGSANASRCCRRWSRTSRSATPACGTCWRPRAPHRWTGSSPTAAAPTSG
jgi:hypothetical protein